MARPAPDRRRFLVAGGTVAGTLLAGCATGSSVETIESNLADAIDALEEAESTLDTVGTALDEDDWETCETAVEDLTADLETARELTASARNLSRVEGHTDHLAASERFLDYVEVFDEVATEASQACEAGRAGNRSAVEDHWETVRSLADERDEKRQLAMGAVEEVLTVS